MTFRSAVSITLLAVSVAVGSLVACSGNNDATATDDATPAAYVNSFTVVNIESGTTPAMNLAVQACAGLYNRRQGGSVYTRTSDRDSQWLDELDLVPGAVVDAAGFLESCVAEFPRCVRYSYASQQKLLPNILTVGAVLEAVPLDEGMAASCEDVVFDATAEFRFRNSPYLATKYIYDNYVDETTGLAMLNPGYDTRSDHVWNPDMTGDMASNLVDFVFSEKLFVVYLVNGCIKPTPQHALLNEIAANNPWPDPIGVYGYADYWMVFGGYLFESQTRCVESRNMGAIPSKTNNLSFFSTRRRPIAEPGEIEQNELEEIEYDPSQTYVAFVVGDGDNIRYIFDQRSEWLRQRLADCDRPDNSCAPITWSISPHLTRVAPDVLEWYYEMSHRTGKDYFMLPPSGHLYSYPASMSEDAQDAFIAATEQDARILGTRSTIDWEWWNTWKYAESEVLPKYASDDGAIGGVFPVNVPYMFPTFTGWKYNQFFKILTGPDGGEAVLFRPREWRGVDDSGSGITKPFYLSPENMAEELAGYPRGTVAYVYMTSDGGLNLENSFMTLAGLLPAHVHLVSADTAARLAIDAYENGMGAE